MKKNHPQICLFQPEIPQNTGSIARLAAATQSRLHLIKPFGFDASNKQLRRAGLDYWPYLDLEIHDSLEDLLKGFNNPKIAFLSKFGKKNYTSIPKDIDIIVFGQETSGLPDWIHETYKESLYSLPMYHEKVRSLNLANTVSVVVYSQLAKLYPTSTL